MLSCDACEYFKKVNNTGSCLFTGRIFEKEISEMEEYPCKSKTYASYLKETSLKNKDTSDYIQITKLTG